MYDDTHALFEDRANVSLCLIFFSFITRAKFISQIATPSQSREKKQTWHSAWFSVE